MSYNTLFEKALQFFDEGRYKEAESFLRQILETAPDQPDVLNMMGLIAQAEGLHEQACSYFSAAIREKPQEVSFYYNLAFSQRLSGHFHEALKNNLKVFELAPQIKEAHNELGCVYESLSEIGAARNQWQAALKLDENYAQAAINLANSYAHDSWDKAKNELIPLTSKFPNEPLLFLSLAQACYHTEELDKALDFVETALDLAQNDSASWHLKGLILCATKKEKQAKSCFLQAEKLAPNNAEILFSVANIYSHEQNFSEAEKRYRRLLELAPKNFAVHNNYAEMLFKQKRTAEALEEYRQAVILNPTSAAVSNNLGVILKDLKDYEQALGLFFNALQHEPQTDEIAVNIAETLILLAENDLKKAQKIAQNWQKSYPDNPFAKYINAALQGENIENHQIFTEKLFDNFADHYELVMQNLGYSAPLAVGRVAGSLEGRLVDLGCGTGLTGLAVKTPQNTLIGVDLSEQMLNLAAQKNIYGELVKSDIIAFLRTRHDFDWIIAADVLGYLGNLEEFIKLGSGKNLIFTIERLTGNKDYEIQPNGRFRHNPFYVEKLLQQNGFCDIYKEDLVLRTENGSEVKGCVFKALKGKIRGY